MHIQTGPAPNLTHGRHPHDCGHGRRPKPAAQSNPRTSCAGADRHITTGRNRVSGTYGLEHDGQSAEIAGQVIVGRMLGARDAEAAHAAARRMIEWAVVAGAVFGLAMLALIDVLPRAFTGDEEVVDRAREIWPLFALMQPANGAVFALDGILIGAGDTRFLMYGMLAAALGVFVPVALLSLALDLGIVGVWAGLVGLIAVRLGTCAWRFSGRRWALVGAPPS